jgi:predicted ATPase/DNA-binding SARP family transcriptional activator
MSTVSEPRLQIRLLGGIGVRRGDGSEIEVKSRASALLLARLACAPNGVLRREALIDALFADEFPETARNRLRQALYLLRRELEPLGVGADAWLHADRETIRLAPGAVTTDVADSARYLERARRGEAPAERAELLGAAAALLAGEFLPGHFDDWSAAERARIQEQRAAVLCDLVTALVETGDLSGAVERAREALAADRLREESHRVAMRVFAAAGRPADAERQYRELERLLEEELGVAPSAETRLLREEIRSGASVTRPAGDSTLPEPAPRSSRARIPQPVNRLHGRAEELGRVERLLAGEASPGASPSPLVTLTGPGGAGKTRLALEIAHRLDGWFEGAVWFIPLEGARDAGSFLDEVAGALELRPTVPGPRRDLIAELLRTRRAALLVLDNFEQLVSTAALELQELRTLVPGLACLVTSRERLGVRGEQELALAPLAVPSARIADLEAWPHRGDEGVPERLLAYPGVQLFLERARAARASFALTAENAGHVAALCRRLDGLPLALELGAAWLAVLSPQQALERLAKEPALLVSRDRDTPERHRSLQAALDSSYLLLPPEHQRLFARLSVFRDGWTLEAAEAVCGGDEVLQRLALLVTRSLVSVEERPGAVRYRLLETMRDYAAARLRESGEAEAAAAAHAEYFRDLVIRHRAGVGRAGREGGLTLVEADFENARAALAWLLRGEATHQNALEVAAALGNFCWIAGKCAEGTAILEQALALTSTEPTVARMRAYGAGANIARLQGEHSRALEWHSQARAIAAALNDLQAVFRAACAMAGVALDRRNLEAAAACIRECDAANATLQVPSNSLLIAFHRGLCADRAGDFALARQCLEESVRLAREHGYPRHLADALCTLGWTYRRDDPARGIRILREGLGIHRDIGHAPMVLEALLGIGTLELASGNGDAGRRTFQDALALAAELRLRASIAAALEGIAAAEADGDTREPAARLFGAAASLRSSTRDRGTPELEEMLEIEVIAAARARCAAEQPLAWEAGAGLPLQRVLEMAAAAGEPRDLP